MFWVYIFWEEVVFFQFSFYKKRVRGIQSYSEVGGSDFWGGGSNIFKFWRRGIKIIPPQLLKNLPQ